VIENVKYLTSELNADPLIYFPNLANGCIQIYEPWPAKNISAHVPKCTEWSGIKNGPVLRETVLCPCESLLQFRVVATDWHIGSSADNLELPLVTRPDSLIIEDIPTVVVGVSGPSPVNASHSSCHKGHGEPVSYWNIPSSAILQAIVPKICEKEGHKLSTQ
jgi:hypothetical protein